MISIFTITLGRELYIKRLIESISLLGGNYDFEHYICFQGVKPSEDLLTYIKNLDERYNIHLELWDKNYGIGEAINKILPKLKGDITIKLDDDAVLRSPNYFSHVKEINRLFPDIVFSPFPVGLINNLGGVQSSNRFVHYGENTDTYYTFRVVNHIGGFARISPTNIIKTFKFPNDLSSNNSGNEDVNFSNYCNQEGVMMCYLENALIVEHQESTLGQHERYGENYFNGRF